MALDTATEGRPPRAPGRPRSATADRAIIEATLRLLVEEGYAGLSLEGVAAAAGVGKTTIYRRYQDKRELAAAAISGFVGESVPTPDTGNARADLITLLTWLYSLLSGTGLFQMIGTLLTEERRNPELLERFRERVIRPNRARIKEILERAQKDGEVRPDADLEIVVDTLVGATLARHLTRPAPSSPWVAAPIDQVWKGVADQPSIMRSSGTRDGH